MGFARSFRRQMKRNKAAAKKRRKVLFEPLEPRLLLSADLSFAMAGAANDLTLQLDQVDGVDTLQLINNEDTDPTTQIVASQALADTSAVLITGAEQDDKFTVDFSTPFSVPNGILFSDAFSGDNDTLKVTGKSNVWNITGNNRGNVDGAGIVDFLGIENLTGGADADTYIFEAGGSLYGTIDGGDGADSLEGADTNNTWEITALDAGALNEQIYENIENLIGGDAQDIFVLGDGAGVTGTIDGGAGSDTLVGPDSDTTWNITGGDAGSVADVEFTSVENLTGGAGADTFIFADGSFISGVLDGGGGINTLDYSNTPLM